MPRLGGMIMQDSDTPPKRRQKRVRDAGTGRFVDAEDAKLRPRETVTETVDLPEPAPRPKRRRRMPWE